MSVSGRREIEADREGGEHGRGLFLRTTSGNAKGGPPVDGWWVEHMWVVRRVSSERGFTMAASMRLRGGGGSQA